MKKVESQFLNKFRLLNSQEDCEKIILTSSDSSDYDMPCNSKLLIPTPNYESRKRKRKSSKNKALNNICKLDVEYINCDQKHTTHTEINKSPVLSVKLTTKPSYMLTESHLLPNTSTVYRDIPSPILPHSHKLKIETSPIVPLKGKSAKITPNVKKKLFVFDNQDTFEVKTSCATNIKDTTNSIINLSLKNSNTLVEKEHLKDKDFTKDTSSLVLKENIGGTADSELLSNNKTYFDNQFSSQTASIVNSISEYESSSQNNSRTSFEIDATSLSGENKTTFRADENITTEVETTHQRKFKGNQYKKNGLAYRLHTLIKKQNAQVALWRHERFLATNSNFLMPEVDYTAFRILNVRSKYGLYSLVVKDINNEKYNILINTIYVNNENLISESIIKLYKPFQCYSVNNQKVIVNALKFECEPYKFHNR